MIVFDLGFEKTKSIYSDYLKTPEGGKFQLIDGEIIGVPSPEIIHQKILLFAGSKFLFFLQSEYKQTDIAKSSLIQDLEINLAEIF